LGRRSCGASTCSLSRRSHRWGGKGKPQWGWWRWTTGSLPPPSLLNPGAAREGRNPYAAPAWTARAPVAAPPPLYARAWSHGRGAGVKGDFPPPVRVRLARGRARSLGVRVAWLARPSHRAPPAWCGSVDPPSGAGEGENRDEGKRNQRLTSGPCPAATQARKRRKAAVELVGRICFFWAGGFRWVHCELLRWPAQLGVRDIEIRF
jgi:hypothetical protein